MLESYLEMTCFIPDLFLARRAFERQSDDASFVVEMSQPVFLLHTLVWFGRLCLKRNAAFLAYYSIEEAKRPWPRRPR